MPVGGTFYLKRKDADYKTVHTDVVKCLSIINKTSKNEIVEENSTYYTRINIEPYVNLLESCLKEINYRVNTDMIKQPVKTVEIERKEDQQLDQTNNWLGNLPFGALK